MGGIEGPDQAGPSHMGECQCLGQGPSHLEEVMCKQALTVASGLAKLEVCDLPHERKAIQN
jgi:hypothetical protein